VPRDLETVCLKCLHKEPRWRYLTAQALAEDLRRFLEGQPILARPTPAWEKGWRWCRRRPAVASMAAALVLVALGGLSLTLYLWRQAVDDRVRALASEGQAVAERSQAEAARQQAEDNFETARRLLAKVVQLGKPPFPQTPGAQRQHTIAALSEAETSLLEVLRQRPSDAGLRALLAEVYAARGAQRFWIDQMEAAEADLQKGQALWEELLAGDGRNVNYRAGLAQAYAWLGHTHLRLGQTYAREGSLSQALQAHQKAWELYQDLAREQLTPAALVQVAVSRNEVIRLLEQTGRLEEALPLMKANHDLAEQLVAANPTEASVSHSLANIYSDLASRYHRCGRPGESVRCRKRAYDQAKRLYEAQPTAVTARYALALCAWRLACEQPAERLYLEARQLAEQVVEDWARRLKDEPTDWVLFSQLKESSLCLAECQQKTGQLAAAAQTYQRCLQLLHEGERRIAAQPALRHQCLALRRECLEAMYQVAYAQMEVGQVAAARATVQQAFAALDRYAASPAGDVDSRYQVAYYYSYFAYPLRHLEAVEESLRASEESRRMFEQLARERPAELRHGVGLSEAWTQIAKNLSRLGQPDEVKGALQRAVEAQRQVLERAPAVDEYRQRLDERYRRLWRHLKMRRHLAEAETCLLDIEKLWPNDADKLRTVARDLRELAVDVGKDQDELSPAEEAERQRYLKESERVEQQAAAVAGRVKAASR
jgi:tetratricopeptide (TPR) repeat protein